MDLEASSNRWPAPVNTAGNTAHGLDGPRAPWRASYGCKETVQVYVIFLDSDL